MRRATILKIFMITLLALTIRAFAPVDIDNIPTEIIGETPEYIEINQKNITECGISVSEFHTKRMRGEIDPISGVPYQIISSGLIVDGYSQVDENNIENFAMDFVSQYPKIAGVSGDNLEIFRTKFVQNRWYVTLSQHENGIRHYDSRLELRVSPDARIFYLRNNLVPGKANDWRVLTIDEAEKIARDFIDMPYRNFEIRDEGMIIMPIIRGGDYEIKKARQFSLFSHEIPAIFRFVISTDGEVLRFNNGLTTVTGTVYGHAYPRNMETPLEVFPWPDARMSIDGDYTYTNPDGTYSSGSGTGAHVFYSVMKGRWCQIQVSGATRSEINNTFTGASYDYTWTDSDVRLDEMNVYYHVSNVHNFVKEVFRWDGMDYMMNATVGQAFDNAYFDGRDINMGAGSSIFYNLGYFADIVQHEYHHGVTGSIYGRIPGIYEGMGLAMNEAFSDYFPCAMSNEPLIGEGGLYRDGTAYMRTVNNARRYPEDYINECHYDGQILSGALWDFRNMIDDWTVDSMAFIARFGYPITFEEYLVELLICDDNDGDITNGTNHGWDMVDAFYAHGIGPGGVSLIHEPLSTADDTISGYPVTALLESYFDLSEGTATLNYIRHYTDTGSFEMTYEDGLLVGNIPACDLGSRVYYNIVVDIDDGRTVTSPEGAPYAWHNFRIEADEEPPSLTHNPVEMRHASNPILINAVASDNQGIDNVTVYWKHNSVEKTPIALIFDNHANNYYTYLTGDFNPGDIIEYKITATDVSMGELISNSPETGWHSIEIQTGFYDQIGPMDHFWETYQVTSGFMNQWHKTTSEDNTGSGGYSWKFGSEGSHDYTNGAEGALELIPIMLEGDCRLVFSHKIDAEIDDRDPGDAWDGGVIEASAGHGWTRIAPQSGWYELVRNTDRSFYPGGGIRVYSGTHDWAEESIDLSGIEGWVSFRFRFGSDLYVTADGWYIDDIRIESEYSAIEYEDGQWNTPDELALSAAPNPFNSQTRFAFTVGDDVQNAKIEIFDMLGNRVEHIDIDTKTGINKAMWNAENHSTGIYLCKLSAGEKEVYEKIIFIK